VSAYSLIAIILATLGGAAGLGYALGTIKRQSEDITALRRQLDANRATLGVHTATLTALTEDYDPPEPTPEERRRAFMVIKGGGAGAPIPLFALLGAKLRRHWRPAAATAGGVTVAAAVTAAALLAHGSPPSRTPAKPAPTRALPTASATPTAASPSPSRARPAPTRPPGSVPPVVPLPIRTRRSTPSGAPVASSPSGPPTPTPSASAPSPSASCTLVYLDALHIISICL
jgi:hypothetical protein